MTVALAAAFGVPAIAAVPAQAAVDATGWWYSALGIADVHAQGWTGDGVDIAVIETHFYPDAPAVAGADITVHDELACGNGILTEPTSEALHGVGVTQMLVAPFGFDGDIGGIVPDAKINVYLVGDDACTFANSEADMTTTVGRSIIAAVDDGNDIINISQGLSPYFGDFQAVAYALAHDVIVVSSSPNTMAQKDMTFPVGANGVVSVAAVSENLDLITDESSGETVVTPEITVVAPGINIGKLGKVGDWSGLGVSDGSSTSAPLTAGALALAKQKYPEATGNQLIQALIHSTVSAQNGLGRDVENGYGYGVISLSGILSTDPLTFPDENPLMDKSMGVPTAADVAAVNGTTPSASPEESEKPEKSAKPSASADEQEVSTPDAAPTGPGALPWIIGGGIVVIGVGVIIFSVVRFRRDAGRS